MGRCEDEQMWRWEGVKMSRCEDERMWRWEDVKMRRCEDERMSRWDVKMRRCFTDPHYWKNPALRRSREKITHSTSNEEKQESPPYNHDVQPDQPGCSGFTKWVVFLKRELRGAEGNPPEKIWKCVDQTFQIPMLVFSATRSWVVWVSHNIWQCFFFRNLQWWHMMTLLLKGSMSIQAFGCSVTSTSKGDFADRDPMSGNHARYQALTLWTLK